MKKSNKYEKVNVQMLKHIENNEQDEYRWKIRLLWKGGSVKR